MIGPPLDWREERRGREGEKNKLLDILTSKNH
jgi:hypothetical protein